MPSNNTRGKARRRHAKWRAAQRYGICLTTAHLERIVDDIRKGRALAGQPVTNTISIKIVQCQETRVAVLYSHKHHEIITCLPPCDGRVRALLGDSEVKTTCG